MSQDFDKISGIQQLPLFPLPLVLLPNEILPLHIFEPRYRQMLKDVSSGNNLFGISFFNSSQSFIERPATDSIGCVAEIREIQTLDDGRSNILTVGMIRYRLLDYVDAIEPYLIGEVEFFEDFEEDANVLEPLAKEVSALFRRVTEATHKLSGATGALSEIPEANPQVLSFLIAVAFNLPHNVKYEMLEMRSTVERLTKARGIMNDIIVRMEETVDVQKIAKTNGHVKNGKRKMENGK